MSLAKKSAFSTLFAAGLLAACLPFAHAADVASETRPVDARVTHVVLDSVVSLKLRQGATPSLVIYADADYIKKITTEQSGDTLRISSEKTNFNWGNKKEMRAELVLPNLHALDSNGVGSTQISGFGGDHLEVDLGGAGSIAVTDSKFKNVKARLSGVGSMNLDARDTDTLELRMPGAGSMNVNGSAKTLQVVLSGVGSLNAKDLTAAKANVTLSGLGSATLTAKEEANVTLSGLGSATVYGQPAQRVSNTSGMGKVSWK